MSSSSTWSGIYAASPAASTAALAGRGCGARRGVELEGEKRFRSTIPGVAVVARPRRLYIWNVRDRRCSMTLLRLGLVAALCLGGAIGCTPGGPQRASDIQNVNGISE